MNKQVFKNAAAALRAIYAKNGVSEDTRSVMEQLALVVDEWAKDEEKDYNIEDLQKAFNDLVAKVEKSEEEVANRIATIRNGLLKEIKGTDVPKLSNSARQQICNAICTEKSKVAVLRRIDEICAAEGVQVKKTRNDVTGLTYAEIVDYAISIKQDDSDELFDMLYKTAVTKVFYSDLDETKAKAIAKQWNKANAAGVVKDIQELAVEGKEIRTANIYKTQRVANEDMDDAEIAGQSATLIAQLFAEERKAVKALAVKALLIGDTVNEQGKRVSTFETIGTKTASDACTTVLNPEVAANPDITDFARAAAELKADGKKVLVISSAMDIALRKFKYGEGGTFTLLSREQLAAVIGVDLVIVKDYLTTLDGVHGIFFIPEQYWVNIKKESEVPFPEWRENAQYFLYEMNMGGVIRGVQSSAVLRENA